MLTRERGGLGKEGIRGKGTVLFGFSPALWAARPTAAGQAGEFPMCAMTRRAAPSSVVRLLSAVSSSAVATSTESHSAQERERWIARIERDIRGSTSGGVRNLEVQINAEGVFLRGHCGTYYCKQLAQHAALPIAADCKLHNLIEVR